MNPVVQPAGFGEIVAVDGAIEPNLKIGNDAPAACSAGSAYSDGDKLVTQMTQLYA